MRGRAKHRDAEAKAGQRIARADAAADIRRARAETPASGVWARRVPNSTTLRPPAASDHARGLARDQGLEGEGREKIGFRDLRLDQRRPHGQDGLAGEHRRALRARRRRRRVKRNSRR